MERIEQEWKEQNKNGKNLQNKNGKNRIRMEKLE